MRAAVFQGPGTLGFEDRPMPVISDQAEVLVAVEACGICGSDLKVLDVPPGHPATPGTILGHEFVGRVEAVGKAADPSLLGRRVVVDPDPKCGACASCRAGRPATCSAIVALGVYRDGALASHVLAPAAACFPIADAVPAPIAALVEPLACVMNGTKRAAVRPVESVVVFGGGAIGCLFTAVLSASGARPVIVVEPRAERGAVARALGASVVVTPSELAERRSELLPDGADVAVDAVGSVLPQAIDVAAQGGRIVVFGMDSTATAPIRQVAITEKGLAILGSYITDFTFPAAIRFVESGLVDLSPLVSSVLPLDDTAEGIARLRSGAATKIVITP
jgi:threonine dehydrogenase-like Zn-dependent dehydrogenase